MKKCIGDGVHAYRPTITKASIPLAVVALLVPAASALGALAGWWPTWVIATAIAGSVLLFDISFLMPFLMTWEVRHGVISGPAGYGVNTLQLERIDDGRSRIRADGSVMLVDDLGSTLHLPRGYLAQDEIVEMLEILGVDARRLPKAGLEAWRLRITGRPARRPAGIARCG